ASVTAPVGGAGARQGAGVEIGPGEPGEHELRVGALPQEKVAEPLLAARAHEEVDVFHELAREALTIALLGSARVPGGRGGDDAVARRIVEGEPQMEDGAALGGALGIAQEIGEAAGQPVAAAQERDANAALDGPRHLAAQEAAQDAEE